MQRIAILLLLLTGLLCAQVKYFIPFQISQSNGRPLNNANVDLYTTGTSTKVYDLTYHDNSDGSYYHTAPITAGVYDVYVNGRTWRTGVYISSSAIYYPIPADSLSTDTLWFFADSGLGSTDGAYELGDSIRVRVHVDSVTIDIFQDTLRVDTTKMATKYYVNDTLTAYWDTTNVKSIVSDSSQYYYWRAKSGYHFPQWSNMVPWNLNDFRTSQDSVDICYFVEASTYWPYMQIEKDAAATDSQYVFPHFAFVAPRDVSDITDTLFAVRYKCTSADTLNVGIKLMVYEGTTARYTATDIVASTSWDTLVVLKTDGTMTSIVEGDEFYLIPYCKVDGDSLWIGRLEERWY